MGDGGGGGVRDVRGGGDIAGGAGPPVKIITRKKRMQMSRAHRYLVGPVPTSFWTAHGSRGLTR